jgi:hypothetical protein
MKKQPIYKRPKFWAVIAAVGTAGAYALNGDWQAAVSVLLSNLVP